MKTLPIIEQHMHGAFGVDFNKANADEMAFISKKLSDSGFFGFFPTLVTDTVENIQRQIKIIKNAAKNCKEILGIHIEALFLNAEKKGIHDDKLFLDLTPDNYKKIEDDFIKIVTLAPEKDRGLIDYLHSKNIKVQAGHCTASDLSKVDGVTHTYNAMPGVVHRGESTALSALIEDNLYTEVIADGVHVSDKALKLMLRAKPEDKVILVSDAIPITYSDEKEGFFAGSKIYYDGKKAANADGTLAGSTKLLPEIIKILAKKGLFKPKFIENVYKYHNIEPKGELIWDKDFNIVEYKKG